MFAEQRARLLDAAELPPGSFFATEPLTFLLMAFLLLGVIRMPTWGRTKRPEVLALAAGLALPPLLMTTAIHMSYRYRMEFYPLFDFLGIVGLIVVARSAQLGALFLRHRFWIAGATVVSIGAAHVSVLLNKLSEFGPADAYLSNGVFGLYRPLIARKLGL